MASAPSSPAIDDTKAELPPPGPPNGDPKFPELSKVRVNYDSGPDEGYIIGHEYRDGIWVYQISHPDPDHPGESWENWMPEHGIELIS